MLSAIDDELQQRSICLNMRGGEFNSTSKNIAAAFEGRPSLFVVIGNRRKRCFLS